MKQIDLDDLPPRVAQAFSGLEAGEVLALVQGGVVVARLVTTVRPPPEADPPEDLLEAEGMKEVMEQFDAMIHDTF